MKFMFIFSEVNVSYGIFLTMCIAAICSCELFIFSGAEEYSLHANSVADIVCACIVEYELFVDLSNS